MCYGAVHGPFTPADRHKGDYKTAKPPVPKDVYPPRSGKPKYVQKMEHWEPKNGEPVEKKVRELGPVGMRDIPGKPLREWIKQYHEGVLAIDEGVGRVLKALKDSDQDENTLVAVVSNLYELSIKKLFVNIAIEIKAINIINVLVPYLPLLPLNIKVVDFGDIKIPRSDKVAPAIMTAVSYTHLTLPTKA